MKKTIYILNGPNINLVGLRETNLYGNTDFKSYLNILQNDILFNSINIYHNQTNSEGKMIDLLHNIGFNNNKNINLLGIVLNAGAYSHTSLAIYDAIKSIEKKVIEVHITNIYSRDKFRHHSVISSACKGVIAGFGLLSYKLALISLLNE